jgi:hypothetical protein
VPGLEALGVDPHGVQLNCFRGNNVLGDGSHQHTQGCQLGVKVKFQVAVATATSVASFFCRLQAPTVL